MKNILFKGVNYGSVPKAFAKTFEKLGFTSEIKNPTAQAWRARAKRVRVRGKSKVRRERVLT